MFQENKNKKLQNIILASMSTPELERENTQTENDNKKN